MNIVTLRNKASDPPDERPLSELKGLGTKVLQGETGKQELGVTPGYTIAWPLFTCAAVIYVSTDENSNTVAWIHHAGSGIVGSKDVKKALKCLGAAASTVIVVYAHPGDNDESYESALEIITGVGILPKNLIEIPSLSGGCGFGINNLGHVGYA